MGVICCDARNFIIVAMCFTGLLFILIGGLSAYAFVFFFSFRNIFTYIYPLVNRLISNIVSFLIYFLY